jgi:hypothetical protein
MAGRLSAALALEELDQQSRAELVRQTGGIVITLGAPAQRALPAAVIPVLEMEPADE